MMRALHVLESLAAGGIETTFLNMLRAWRGPTAWASHHVLALAGGPLEDAYRAVCDGVTIASTPDDLERATTRPFDVVYILFDRVGYRLMPWLVGQSRVPVIYGKGYDMSAMFRADRALEWQAEESMLWGVDGATFTTDRLMAEYDAPGRPTVLGKAADVRHFLAIPPVSDSTPRRVVCVANLHVRKRLGDLVTATAKLRTTIPDVRLRLVGADDGREASRLRNIADTLGVGEACEIVGRRIDVARDFADSMAFALPSGCEGVPTAMLEAMAAARPVVVTDVGHVASAVQDGTEGFLVAEGDIEALTARLRTVLTDTRLAARMGAAGRERAGTHEVQTVAARLRSVLESAARGRTV